LESWEQTGEKESVLLIVVSMELYLWSFGNELERRLESVLFIVVPLELYLWSFGNKLERRLESVLLIVVSPCSDQTMHFPLFNSRPQLC
jgi:hypothetical protein